MDLAVGLLQFEGEPVDGPADTEQPKHLLAPRRFTEGRHDRGRLVVEASIAGAVEAPGRVVGVDDHAIRQAGDEDGQRARFEDRGQSAVALLQFLFGPLSGGDVAARAHGADDLPVNAVERRLVHLEEQQGPADVAGFFEAGGASIGQRDDITVRSMRPESLPLGVVRMPGAFTLRKEGSRAADGFVGAAGLQQLLTDRLVGEEETLLQILRPDHVRHVVAQQAQHHRQGARTGLALPERRFSEFALGDVHRGAHDQRGPTLGVPLGHLRMGVQPDLSRGPIAHPILEFDGLITSLDRRGDDLQEAGTVVRMHPLDPGSKCRGRVLPGQSQSGHVGVEEQPIVLQIELPEDQMRRFGGHPDPLFGAAARRDVAERPHAPERRPARDQGGGEALEDSPIPEQQGVGQLGIGGIDGPDPRQERRGVGHLAHDVIQKHLVVPGRENGRGDPPQLRETPIRLNHAAGTIHGQDAIGGRSEDALQLGVSRTERLLGAMASGDVAGEQDEGGDRPWLRGLARDRELEPEAALRQGELELQTVRAARVVRLPNRGHTHGRHVGRHHLVDGPADTLLDGRCQQLLARCMNLKVPPVKIDLEEQIGDGVERRLQVSARGEARPGDLRELGGTERHGDRTDARGAPSPEPPPPPRDGTPT